MGETVVKTKTIVCLVKSWGERGNKNAQKRFVNGGYQIISCKKLHHSIQTKKHYYKQNYLLNLLYK